MAHLQDNIDPRLRAEDSLRFSSSQSFQSSSSVPSEPFLSSSSPSFLASTDSLSRAEVHRLFDQLKSVQEKQGEIFALLRNHEEQLKGLAEKRQYDGDDEGYQSVTHRQRKKKKKTKNDSANSKVLTKYNVGQLTEAEKKVRNEIMAHLQKKMKRLVGLKSDEVSPQDSNKESEGSKERDGDGDDPDEDDDGNVEDDDGDEDEFPFPDFTKDVGDGANKRLIDQAAFLVYKQQINPETRKLTFENVNFTSKDVEELSKDVFRVWKKKYETQTDPIKGKKRNAMLKKGSRRQRKRHKKIARGLAVAAYKHRHGDMEVDKLLLTDWMSDEVSDRSDLENKEDYQNEKLVKAGYSLEAKDVEVWEIVKPAFRSSEINAVYLELDEISERKPKKTNSKKQSVKRVFLGRMNNELPESAPYPFMVSTSWKRLHVEAKGRTEEFEVLPEDPVGFGTKFGQVLKDL